MLMAIPNHVIQVLYLTRSVCDSMDKKISDLLWEDLVHIVNWDKMT